MILKRQKYLLAEGFSCLIKYVTIWSPLVCMLLASAQGESQQENSEIQRAIHNFRDWCCPLVKRTNFGPTGHNHLRSSPFPRVRTVPSASAIV
jgi:hypothetical protein